VQRLGLRLGGDEGVEQVLSIDRLAHELRVAAGDDEREDRPDGRPEGRRHRQAPRRQPGAADDDAEDDCAVCGGRRQREVETRQQPQRERDPHVLVGEHDEEQPDRREDEEPGRALAARADAVGIPTEEGDAADQLGEDRDSGHERLTEADRRENDDEQVLEEAEGPARSLHGADATSPHA